MPQIIYKASHKRSTMVDSQPNIGVFNPKPTGIPMQNTEVVSQVNSLGRRLRMVEESLSASRKKADLDEQNNLNSFRKNATELQAMSEEIRELRLQLKSFKEDMIKIIRELQGTAKKEDVTRIEKYVDLWEPSKFVTQNEVHKIVDFVVEQQQAKLRKVNAEFDQTNSIRPTPNHQSYVDEESPYHPPKEIPIINEPVEEEQEQNEKQPQASMAPQFPRFTKQMADFAKSLQEKHNSRLGIKSQSAQEESQESEEQTQPKDLSEDEPVSRQEILSQAPQPKKPKKKLHELF